MKLVKIRKFPDVLIIAGARVEGMCVWGGESELM